MTKRDKLQEEFSNKIYQANFKGIIILSPRFGKTKTFLQALDKTINKKILLIVDEVGAKDTWANEITKWNYTGNITIECMASLEKHKDTTWDIVYVDEIHKLSFNKICILANMLYHKRIGSLGGMTGTLDAKNRKQLKTFLKLDILHEYSIEQAIKDKIIADYEIVLCPVKMTNEEYKLYSEVTDRFEQCKKDAEKNPSLSFKKKLIAGERARLIYGLQTKIKAAKNIINRQNRCMIFTALTSVADELAPSYHGKTKKENNLEKFKKGEIDKCAVAKLANTGQTIPNLKVGVVHQLWSSENTALQRILRMCNLEGKTKAKIYVTYYKGTVDEDWTLNALQSIPKNKIKTLKIV